MQEQRQQYLLDRLALNDLVCRYAELVDELAIEEVLKLFCADGELSLRLDPSPGAAPLSHGRGHDELRQVFEGLRHWQLSTHFLGNHRAVIDGDTAAGTTYALAHHLAAKDEGKNADLCFCLRYYDDFQRQGGEWLFKRRKLVVSWQRKGLVKALINPRERQG